MQPVTVTIAEDGTIQFLMSEGAEVLLDGDTLVRRASHVEPDSLVLRLAFHGLRSLFGEEGSVGNFTRRWPCAWRVDTSPLGGPVLDEVWYNRQDAIDSEISYVNEHLI